MTNSKNTKRALLASILSLLVCLTMLIGSTFAWFTDSVASGNNKIVAGNLAIELEYATAFDAEGNPTAWKSVEGSTDLFNADSKWEPGHTEVVVFRIRNTGSLALKYRLAVDKITETSSYNADKTNFYLSDYLVFNKTADATLKAREAYWNADLEDLVLNDGTKNSNPTFSDLSIPDTTLEAGAEEIFTVAVYMPTSVGNEANWSQVYSFTKAPSIELGFTLFATQASHEEDSFDNSYDADAKYDWDGKSETAFEDLKIDEAAKTVSVNNAEDLVGALNNVSKLSGYTVKLDKSVDLNDQKWTSKRISNITLDGQGNTISGLNSDKGGLLASTSGNVTVKNLTVTGTATYTNNVGGLVNDPYGNLTVDNCIIDVDVTDSTANNNIGGVVGTGAHATSITIRNTVNKGNISGKLAGGIIGFINTSKTVVLENNTNEGTITSPTSNAGGIVGHIMNAPNPIVGTIRGCTNKGEVNAKNFAGGILGYTTVTGWSIVDSTNTGAVTGSTAGGILGGTNVTGVIVENCQNSGTVTGNTGGGSV